PRADPRTGVADPGGEVLAPELARQRAEEPGDSGITDHEGAEFFLAHLGQPLLARALQVQIVLLGVELPIRSGEDEPVVDELVEGVGVGSELGGLQAAVGRAERFSGRHASIVPDAARPHQTAASASSAAWSPRDLVAVAPRRASMTTETTKHRERGLSST